MEQHTRSRCHRRRRCLDVTRPQLFPGRQRAEPRLTFILSCTCGSQTHFVRDPLSIATLLRNALPFQNLQSLHMIFPSFTFSIPDSSEELSYVTRKEKKRNSDLRTTAYLALCLNTFVFSFMLKRMLAFTHRIYGRRQREGGLSPGVVMPYLMTASAYVNGELSINQFLFILC